MPTETEKEAALDHAELIGQINAIHRSQAVIEFNLDGTIITANQNFLHTMGYRLEEIKGKHHRMFVSDKEAKSNAYKVFWSNLANGKFLSGEFHRYNKKGEDVWLQASYNPILGEDKKPMKVIKFASDITAEKIQAADYQGQIEAISKAQAVIEFNLDGTIITANQNFLDTMRYSLDEIKGKHHRMFVLDSEQNSAHYKQFWQNLKQGKYQSGEYQRVDRHGNDVWLQASYNPIYDPEGNPFKVVKYASNITEAKKQSRDDREAKEAYTQELNHLIACFQEGQLSKRANLDHLRQDYAQIMSGLNSVIDIILAPIEEFQERLTCMASGDLTAYVEGDYVGDHAILKQGMNQSLDALNKIMREVRTTTLQVNQGSTQVAEAGESLSQAATQQAAALEEITASMTELSSQTQSNADHATTAKTLATSATEYAELGNTQMKRMLQSMTDIDNSSNDISKIIKVIDEIAFQTNLLALNAAVEAARAGIHGKGFAVVAEEVRNLAARSANAAKETTEMISQSIDRVKQGSSIAEETYQALDHIVTSVNKVTTLVAEIASASKEQAQGIAQINNALNQLDSVTQGNTANAEKSASASNQLASLAKQLEEQLSAFKLKKEVLQKMDHSQIPAEMWQAFQQFMAYQQQQ